ncbi:hypothetical protein F909_03142 [Acinetobacter sp. ANC 3929]|uniref:TorF family putative porin n=1 Tax=unclassified Acinetobacter TaxID=196816 RepID=UPI0002CEAF74|nr:MULTISPECIES: TorF family putative porin [unclassified Acinetobacter]ENW79531.1 hypothetical protein F909_03142 [Acinetobacter sp. ANC 3929]MCH7351866.1 hypothetical protein [Acinetobacter sp. NIPH 2023]MCH7356051.1 hypothetical protein [Acinetobacter sp. NIPH 1958]MCH7359509.1 hypothetical protein [Acinetobacter sp. NIPH 2024]
MLRFHQGLIAMLLFSGSVYAEDSNKKMNISGSLTFVSDYVLRGATNYPEKSDVTLQGVLTLSYDNIYVSYFGSKLGYSFSELQHKNKILNDPQLTDREKTAGIDALTKPSSDYYEHDLILGYKTSLDKWDLDFNLATYLYPGGENTTSVEMGIFLNRLLNDSIGNSINFTLQTYLNDVVYANQLDTYLTLSYLHPLPNNFSLGLSSAFSYFNDNGKYEGGLFLNTTEDFAWRFSAVELSRPILKDQNALVSMKYMFGGENRSGEAQKNMPVFSVSYNF